MGSNESFVRQLYEEKKEKRRKRPSPHEKAGTPWVAVGVVLGSLTHIAYRVFYERMPFDIPSVVTVVMAIGAAVLLGAWRNTPDWIASASPAIKVLAGFVASFGIGFTVNSGVQQVNSP